MKKFVIYADASPISKILGVGTLILHDETLGVTQRALKTLRDELAQRIEHELLIFKVPSENGAHCEIYGFFLVDKTAGETVIIGDGFRGDGGGEGGSGHRAALALLAIYHLVPIEIMPEDAILYREDESSYQEIVNKVLGLAGQYRFEVPRNKRPVYMDWCFRR